MGFDPTLFECIDNALVATLGKSVVAALYYNMSKSHGLSETELPRKPLEVIQHLKEILGETAFRAIEKPVVSGIRERFEIVEDVHDLQQTIELAKRNYLQASL